MKYVRVACLLLEVLLAETEGCKYLEEKNPLIFQIADLLRVEVEGVRLPLSLSRPVFVFFLAHRRCRFQIRVALDCFHQSVF